MDHHYWECVDKKILECVAKMNAINKENNTPSDLPTKSCSGKLIVGDNGVSIIKITLKQLY